MPSQAKEARERKVELGHLVLGVIAVVALERTDIAANVVVLLGAAAVILFGSAYLQGALRRLVYIAGLGLATIVLLAIAFTIKPSRSQTIPKEVVNVPKPSSTQVPAAPPREAKLHNPKLLGGGEQPEMPRSSPEIAPANQPSIERQLTSDDKQYDRHSYTDRPYRSLVAQILPPFADKTGIHIEAVIRNDGQVPEVIIRGNLIVAARMDLQGMVYGPSLLSDTTILQPGEARLIKQTFSVDAAALRERIPHLPSHIPLPVAVAFRTYDPDGRTIDNQTVAGQLVLEGDNIADSGGWYARADLLHDTVLEAARKQL
jgi:hypothetical protein